jgi:hypothetical protein
MNQNDLNLFTDLVACAVEYYDGHFTICRFTTNWRVGFGTPDDREDINDMRDGKTFAEAAPRALIRAFTKKGERRDD